MPTARSATPGEQTRAALGAGRRRKELHSPYLPLVPFHPTSPSPHLPPTQQEEPAPAPAPAVNSWQGRWLIQMNLVGKRLSSQNQPTWNNLQGPALVRRVSQGSMEAKKGVGVGRSLRLQRLPLGNEVSFSQPYSSARV